MLTNIPISFQSCDQLLWTKTGEQLRCEICFSMVKYFSIQKSIKWLIQKNISYGH